MAAPLSRLQKTILVLAFRNHKTAGHRPHKPHRKDWNYVADTADVTYAEILAAYYGWVLEFPANNSRVYHFSRRCIGPKHYDAAMAALSRATLRLSDRRLGICVWGIEGHWSGLDLTAMGVEVAQGLSLDAGSLAHIGYARGYEAILK